MTRRVELFSTTAKVEPRFDLLDLSRVKSVSSTSIMLTFNQAVIMICAFIRFQTLPYAVIRFHTLSYAFIRFYTLSFAFILCFHTLTGGQGQKSERGTGAVSFSEGGCQFFPSGGVTPPSTQKNFRLRHLLLLKVVRPPVLNLRCGKYSLAIHLQIII